MLNKNRKCLMVDTPPGTFQYTNTKKGLQLRLSYNPISLTYTNRYFIHITIFTFYRVICV